jgi:hypothetical protein
MLLNDLDGQPLPVALAQWTCFFEHVPVEHDTGHITTSTATQLPIQAQLALEDLLALVHMLGHGLWAVSLLVFGRFVSDASDASPMHRMHPRCIGCIADASDASSMHQPVK